MATRKNLKADAIADGRKVLRAGLLRAEETGTIYYTIPSVSRSGMSRTITLHMVCHDRDERYGLVRCWPGLTDEFARGLTMNEHHAALDAVAKDWGFSYDARAFKVGGCGMDMVFALVDKLASAAGLNVRPEGEPDKNDGRRMYANRVRRESV